MCNYNYIFNGIDNNLIGVLGKVPTIKHLHVGDERSYILIYMEWEKHKPWNYIQFYRKIYDMLHMHKKVSSLLKNFCSFFFLKKKYKTKFTAHFKFHMVRRKNFSFIYVIHRINIQQATNEFILWYQQPKLYLFTFWFNKKKIPFFVACEKLKFYFNAYHRK